jgi:uncharacterized RDD family membrane protein YckC
MSVPPEDDPRWGQPDQSWAAPPPPAGPGPDAGLPPTATIASMGQRLAARLLDVLIVSVPFVLFLLVFGRNALDGLDLDALLAVDPETGQPQDPVAYQAAVTGFVGRILGWVLVFTALVAIYEVGLTATRGATLGKAAVGVRVVDAQHLGTIGWGRSLLRWVIPWGAGLLCGVAQLLIFASPLFDGSRRNQGWHDKAANDLVIRSR